MSFICSTDASIQLECIFRLHCIHYLYRILQRTNTHNAEVAIVAAEKKIAKKTRTKQQEEKEMGGKTV